MTAPCGRCGACSVRDGAELRLELAGDALLREARDLDASAPDFFERADQIVADRDRAVREILGPVAHRIRCERFLDAAA